MIDLQRDAIFGPEQLQYIQSMKMTECKNPFGHLNSALVFLVLTTKERNKRVNVIHAITTQ